MNSKTLLAFLTVCFVADCSYGQNNFRHDYKYIEAAKSFYKIHLIEKTWEEAKAVCESEGTIFYYPKNYIEAQAVLEYWHSTHTSLPRVFVGISDLVNKGTFATYDGIPIKDIYNNWAPGEPNDSGGFEDCVIMRQDGTLNDVECEKYAFICKKTVQSLELEKKCATSNSDKQKFSRNDYNYVEAPNSFYKIHVIEKTWQEAKTVCESEGTSFYYPENKVEAKAVLDFWHKTQKILPRVFVGISDLVTKGHFATYDGIPISKVYNRWANGEPNNDGGSEDCVIMRRDGTLNDVQCEKYAFICKKKLDSSELDKECKNNKPNLPVPNNLKFFRKDFKYLEASDSFYKIHTVEKTWQEAKRICELEGAQLYYAENAKEARAVLGFWHSTQPLPRIFVGISDLIAKGVFETYDGIPIKDIYNNWAPGEPNDSGGFEDCVIMRRDGTLNDVECEKYAYICKKTYKSLKWNTKCNMPNSDYTFIKDIGSCFKYHKTPLTWTEAYAVCSAEQSYLAIINSQEEADYLELLANVPPVVKHKQSEAIHLGFHNRGGEGWRTVRGTKLEDSGYVRWGQNQPDGGDDEQCGSILYNGRLNDVSCNAKGYFFCEHNVDTPVV